MESVAVADAAALPHVFFLPFPAAGHSIPMLDVAALFASRGAASTVVVLGGADDDGDSDRRNGGGGGVRFLSLPFSRAAAGLAGGDVPPPGAYATPEFEAALDAAGEPFLELLKAHRPDCVVADLQIPFAAEHAAALAIPHLTLQVTCAFSLIAMGMITHAQPHRRVASPSEPFVVPGLPHRIELTPAQLPSHLTAPGAADRNRRILAAQRGGGGRSLGMILNTFRELEPDYVDMLRRAGAFGAWCVGPVSSSSAVAAAAAAERRRSCGNRGSSSRAECLRWLDRYSGPPGSVLFLCFGSQGRFTRAQRREIARGLEIAGVPFVWVVNSGEEEEEEERTRVSGGKEEEQEGLVVRGWAPQVEVLGHGAVGGFATHCGWNSCMEGIAAGAAMVTWPLYAEQFVNERMLVDVLGVGAPVGARAWGDLAEERGGLVAAEAVAAAIARVMGEGAEAEGRRRRAREIAEAARRAAEDGGSAHGDMGRLVAEIRRIKEEKEKKIKETEKEKLTETETE